MELSPEVKTRLLARHQALTNLAQFLEGDSRLFISFVENVCQLEKKLEEKEDSGQCQCQLMTCLFSDERLLKRILVSQEWQQASEYFVVPSNESAILDLYYRLEIGNAEAAEGGVITLRNKLLHEAFFKGEAAQGEARLSEGVIKFVFMSKIKRWSLLGVEWQVEQRPSGTKIIGKLVVSVGSPRPDGPVLYRNLFAFSGSEKQAIATMGARSFVKNDLHLQLAARDLAKQQYFEVDKLKDWLKDSPKNLQHNLKEWLAKDSIEREFSPAGLGFLRDCLAFLREHSENGYQYCRNRLLTMGFQLSEREEVNTFDFSETVKRGEILSHQPAIQYYWPPEECLETALPGCCNISAGPMPSLLQKVYQFAGLQLLDVRPADVDALKHLLFYLRLGDKQVTKPPILPVYNGMRRWVEALSQKSEYKALESLCYHAQILRAFVQVPCIGKQPVIFPGRANTLIPKYAPDYEPGTIVGIKAAGLFVPSDKMPLFLPGTYWIASDKMPSAEQ